MSTFDLMGLYQKYILPRAINVVCSHESISNQRERVVPLAEGKVLEIGIGSGLNICYYNAEKVTQLTGIDPSVELWNRRPTGFDELSFPVEYIRARAEVLPFEDNSFDSVVSTFTLCTVEDPLRALREMNRVLKPDGRLLFCEHGIAPDRHIRVMQNTFNLFWKPVGGGCNLNRDIPALILEGGFDFINLNSMYSSNLKIASYNYCGSAVGRT